MSQINETRFTANVKSWIDSICSHLIAIDPGFPFLGAEVEVRKKGKLQRRDLILRPKNNPNGFALTGEVKLPDKPDGKSPYQESLVLDAHEKANSVGVEYFFTWNVNRFVLWQTFKKQTSVFERQLNFYDWATVTDSEQLLVPEIIENLKRRWEEFLIEYAAIYNGAKPFIRRSLDQWFIHLLESALDRPTVYAHASIQDQYHRNKIFHENLDQWMVRNLGATISVDDEADNLHRAAKYACYVVTNRIVFYDALRRKYSDRLRPLVIPKNLRNNTKLLEKLQTAFQQAVEATDDYETVFRGDDFGDSLPFLSNSAIDAWRELIEQVDAYDFTRLDYDIIGQIFDGLISPKERHRYGQHYTKSEIVDIINAFTIRKPDAKVLDPACGGGTFLIRAFARMKYLASKQHERIRHTDLLSRIYGVDLSAYAVHLSTISLATRDLVRASNYPRVTCKDFFDVSTRTTDFPAGISDERDEITYVTLPKLDAIIGNPPYIRQEKLTKPQKNKYRQLAEGPWHELNLSGRSDIHVYFWPYAASFLTDDGYFGFLTSSSWLDVEYGFPLQRWLLENFAIVAILESNVEPWFTDARVATTVTIVRREPDIRKRQKNIVRFVQIRKPLAEIIHSYHKKSGDTFRLEAAERICEYIESLTDDIEDEMWRIRTVTQGDLVSSFDLSDDLDEVEEDSEAVSKHKDLDSTIDPASKHTGAKWGIHLRAPDIYFELLNLCREKLVPLSEISEIRYGVKSGCDAFFYPRDITALRIQEYGAKRFKDIYGVSPSEAKRIRVCKAGDGSIHLIESRFLEPLIHSVLDLEKGKIIPEDLEQSILLISESKSRLRNTHVLEYILFGESAPLGSRSSSPATEKTTVDNRASDTRLWYDITDAIRPSICWPKAHQYKHIVPRNTAGLVCNCRLYGIDAKHELDCEVLHRVLQSTIVALMKFLFGRFTGREGNLDTMVCDVKMMLVPDIRCFNKSDEKLIIKAGEHYNSRNSDNLIEECKWNARWELDNAVLRAMGVQSGSLRKRIIAKLYEQISKQIDSIRQLELIAQRNRLRAARRGRSTPQSLAGEIWDSVFEQDNSLRPFPQDFIPRLNASQIEILEISNGRTRLLEMFGNFVLEIGKETYQVEHEERARLLLAIATEGYEGKVVLPLSRETCRMILNDWREYQRSLNIRFEELAEQRTADPAEHERIVADLWRRYRRWSKSFRSL